jgi:thiosulfate dehydrogenase [quinone] large subunit
VHALISPLGHVAVPLGIIIALGELAVGAGSLLGFRARLAAAGGIALSLLLFLTVSFHSSPYYTGADIVFAFAWTPLLLAGTSTVLSLDAVLADRAARAPKPGTGRREVVVTAAVAGASLAVGGLAAGLGRLAGGTSGQSEEQALSPAAAASSASSSSASSSSASSSPASSASSSPAATASGSDAATAAPGQTPPGKAIGAASKVPVGQAASFTDPSSGDPSLVIQPSAGTFVAFDAVCPHAGCTVGYNAAQKVIACPCHGSQFNASTGAVEVGPATRGLKKLTVAEGSSGQLYVS